MCTNVVIDAVKAVGINLNSTRLISAEIIGVIQLQYIRESQAAPVANESTALGSFGRELRASQLLEVTGGSRSSDC